MKSLVDISLLRLRVGRLRWLVLFLLGAAVPLHGQDDLARQAVELMQAGRFHDAEMLWRQLQARSPNDPAIHSNLGVTLAQQGQFDAATAEYRKALSLSPRQPEVAFDLGVAEFKQGHFSQAIPAFKTVAKLKPEDPRSTLLLGMSYYGLRQYASATPYLQQAVRMSHPTWNCITCSRRAVYGARNMTAR